MKVTREPRFLLAGDAALVVEFGAEISLEVNRRVHTLAHALEQNPLPGLGEAVPSYRSLLVHYDPLQLSCEEVKSMISEVLEGREEILLPEPRAVEIPTVYGGEFGPDIEFVAEQHALSVKEVVQLHSGATYTVYMLGFTPGFPYLGGLPAGLATPRLATPRVTVPAGSVGIAGSQTGIYPIATPGGWQLIGRTPVTLFDPQRTPPTCLRLGDKVRFVPISAQDFETLALWDFAWSGCWTPQRLDRARRSLVGGATQRTRTRLRRAQSSRSGLQYTSHANSQRPETLKGGAENGA